MSKAPQPALGVARATCQAKRCWCDEYSWQNECIARGGAGIRALREPTEAMVAEGIAYDAENYRPNVMNVWQAMIDAALR